MNKEELAAHLNGREYPFDLTREECANAKADGLVIVYGASDDLIELAGAIRDEGVACGDFTVRVGLGGIIEEPSRAELNTLKKFKVDGIARRQGSEIKALWNRDGISWQYETLIPHAPFEIKEDGEIYCRGLVFSIHDI